MLRKKTLQIFWLTIGWISFSLGFIGVFLPILPTTPFMLLAAYCFDRGSPRLHHWLLNLPKIGPLIQNWQEKRIIPMQAKVIAVLTIIIGFFSMWFNAPDRILPVKILIAMVMLSVIFFISKQKSK